MKHVLLALFSAAALAASVVAQNDGEKKDSSAVTEREPIRKEVAFEAKDGTHYHFAFDTTVAPDLTEWTDKNLVPVVKEWYPKLVAMLPSEGYTAPTNVTIKFSDRMGGTPAAAGGG